jgi:hypothetical protein
MAGRPARPTYAAGRPGLCWTKVLVTRPEAPLPLAQLPVSQCSGSGSSILPQGRSGSKLCHHKKREILTFPSFFTNDDLYHLKNMSKFTLCTTQVLKIYLRIYKRNFKNNLTNLIALSRSKSPVWIRKRITACVCLVLCPTGSQGHLYVKITAVCLQRRK